MTTFLFVGRVAPMKGVHFLLEAASRMVNELRLGNVEFVICGPALEFGEPVGHSTYQTQLSTYVDNHRLEKHVVFTGAVHIDKLKEYYATCDVVVLPSLFETSPSVIKEAMSFGKPVVASNVGDISECVSDSISGFLVRPGDVEDLVNRLVLLASDEGLRRRCGNNAAALMKTRFDWSVILSQLITAYGSISNSCAGAQRD